MTHDAWLARKEMEMANENEIVFKNAEINVFVKTPDGFKSHIKITDVDSRKVATVLENLSSALVNHNFTADAGPSGGPSSNGGAPSQHVANEQNPACDTCGGATEFRNGKSKAGKAYAGYFCLKDKEHKPHWV